MLDVPQVLCLGEGSGNLEAAALCVCLIGLHKLPANLVKTHRASELGHGATSIPAIAHAGAMPSEALYSCNQHCTCALHR